MAIAPAAYIGSTDTLFHYDLDGKLIAELDPTTKQVKREIIWLGEQPVALIAGATPTQRVSGTNAPALYYVHADHLNTPRMVTDTAGGRRWDWGLVNNEPFGATAPNEAPQGQAAAQQFALNLRFPGQYLDKETGTSYNYYRNYNPVTGRYLQSDPIGPVVPSGMNAESLDPMDVGAMPRMDLRQSTPQYNHPYLYGFGNALTYTDPLGLHSGGGGGGGSSGGGRCADEKNCEILRDNILKQTCAGMRNLKKRAACVAAAWLTYWSCLAKD